MVDEWKTNLMSLAILFHLLCAQHVSDINISIFSSLRLCWWITTSVVLFSVRCVLELLLRLVFGGVRFAGFSLVFHSSTIAMMHGTINIRSISNAWASPSSHVLWRLSQCAVVPRTLLRHPCGAGRAYQI